MKKFLWILLLLFSGNAMTAQLSRGAADALYEAGRYRDALEAYTKLKNQAALISKDSLHVWDWLIFRTRNRLGDFSVLPALETYVKKQLPRLEKNKYYLKILDELSYAYINQRMAPRAIENNREILQKYKAWNINDPIIYSNALKAISFSFTMVGAIDSSEYYNLKNLEFLKKNLKPDDVEVGYAHYYLGITYEEKSEISKAIQHLNEAKKIILAKNGMDHPHIGTISDALARCYEAEGNYDEAEKSYQTAIRIFKKLSLENNLVMTYINLSRLETSLGKNGNSKVYLDEAKRLSLKNDRYVYPIKGFILKGMASYEMNYRSDYAAAKILLTEALQDQIDHEEEGIGLAHSYYAVAYAMNLDKDTNGVFYYLDHARKIFEEYSSNTPHSYINLINDYGTAYLNRGAYKKALDYYYQSLEMYLKTLGKNHIHVSETYTLIADCYRAMGQSTQADSIIEVGSAYIFEKGYRQNANFPLTHLNLLYARLEVEFAKAKSPDAFLQLFDKASNISYTSVFKRNSLINAEDLIFYNANADQLNLLMLKQAQNAFQKFGDDVFYKNFANFANTYKSNLISTKINEEKLLQASGLDHGTIYRYKKIRTQARRLELISAEDTQVNIDSINQEKTKVHEALTQWQTEVEKKFGINLGQLLEPKYRSGTKALEKYLCKEKAMILLFVEDGSSYFLYAMGCGKIDRYIVGAKDSLESMVGHYLTLVKTLRPEQQVLRQGYKVFEALMGKLSLVGINKLIILQEGLLNSLNFEMLVCKPVKAKTSYKNADWLFKTHEIMYAQYLPELTSQQGDDFSGKKMLVISPEFSGANHEVTKTLGFSLTSAPWTKELCQYLHKTYQARLLDGPLANVSNWEKNKNKYKYIHFGTHAIMDTDQPLSSRMLLGDEAQAIDFYQILQSKIQAELVVLGACETGLGKDNDANDIYSLALAFQYSGVKSIIQSLWKIDDETSNEIFRKFYEFKKKGFSSSEALRLSKIDFLNTHDGEKLNPYYWAGLVYISNEVYDKPWPYAWWGVGFLLLIVLGFYFLMKKNYFR